LLTLQHEKEAFEEAEKVRKAKEDEVQNSPFPLAYVYRLGQLGV